MLRRKYYFKYLKVREIYMFWQNGFHLSHSELLFWVSLKKDETWNKLYIVSLSLVNKDKIIVNLHQLKKLIRNLPLKLLDHKYMGGGYHPCLMACSFILLYFSLTYCEIIVVMIILSIVSILHFIHFGIIAFCGQYIWD